jgi:hypothetical protein
MIMKVQELYIGEIMLLIAALDLQQGHVTKTYFRRMKWYRVRYFFLFWGRDEMAKEMLMESKAVLEMLNGAKELRDKLLDSQGVDDDMQPISLKDLIAKQATNN